MENRKSMFIKIDEFIFHKLDLLKNDGVTQKFNDALANLDEAQQKVIAQVVTFSFILIPFVFVGVFWWGNAQTRKSIDMKKQIIEQIALFDGNKNALNNISANYLAPNAIGGREELENKITNLLSANAIDQSKVQITAFQQTSTSSSIAKIEADLTFNNFGTMDFSNLMRTLIEGEKFKVLKIDLSKNNETNLLNGTISLMHMGQNNSVQEQ